MINAKGQFIIYTSYSMIYIFIIYLTYHTSSISLEAKDFGIFGHQFPVIEESLLEKIQSSVSNLDQLEVEIILQKLQLNYSKRLQEPIPVQGVRPADCYEVNYYDPTITVGKNILDHQGNIIIKKGTSHNPLRESPLTQNLLFFDATNQAEVDWAKRESGNWVLVKGKPLELEENEQRPVFFDQGGVLSTRFGITKVPTKISQEGEKLKIESFPVGKR